MKRVQNQAVVGSADGATGERDSRPDHASRPHGWAVGIFLTALAIRLLHVGQIRDAPFFALLLGDARGYDEWARWIAAGDWIGAEVFYQAPLYPYFLGVLYSVFGHDLLIVRIVQAALGAASAALLGLAVWRLVTPRAGVVAGLALALYAPAIFFDGLMQKAVLDVFFICLALWILSGCIPASSSVRPSPARWLALGAAMGALSLTRENALVLVAVIGLWALIGTPPSTITAITAMTSSDKRRARRDAHGAISSTSSQWGVGAALAFVAGLTMVLLPVAARNYAVGGGFYLTTAQFGPNFYIGNNAQSDGTYASLRPGRGAPEYERQDATDLAEIAVGRRLSPADVSSYWTDRALDFITTQPGAWLRLMGRKVLLLWNADEMLDTESQETYSEWSLPLRVFGWVGHFGILVPLAAFGMWTLWQERRRLWVIYAMTAAYAASVVMFYVFARYRFPLVPMLVLFGSAGIDSAARLGRSGGQLFLTSAGAPPPALAPAAMLSRSQVELRRSISVSSRRGWGPGASKKKLTVLASSVVAVAVLSNWPLLSASVMRAITESNLAAALQAEGRVDEALAHYQKAIDIEPGYAPAYNNMGTALRAKGNLDAAVSTYRRALEVMSNYPDAHYNLANALMDQNKPVEAGEHFRIALKSIPGEARVHNNLGIALAAEGKLDEAIAAFRTALATDPRSAITHRNLGDALSSRGRFEEAVQHLQRAVELSPKEATFRHDLGSVLLEGSRFPDAVAEFRRAIELDPGHVGAHNNLGIALASQNLMDEAVGHFQQALKLQPGFPDAERNLELALRAKGR